MSTQTQELLEICEKLPEAKRIEVADFARFLLARNEDTVSGEAVDRWLISARGVAKSGVTTDQVMTLTRGES
jgi:hypothetical protein